VQGPCRDVDLGDRCGADRGWTDQDRLRPHLLEPGGHLRLRQCGVHRGDDQPGPRRTQEPDDELGIVGTDEANRVCAVQPRAAEAGGHVIDHGGQGPVGQGYPVRGDHERSGAGTVAYLPIEEIDEATDRRAPVSVLVTHRCRRRIDHDHYSLHQNADESTFRVCVGAKSTSNMHR
jgi:hypothetical protein